ncbi:hypothetical protein ACGFR8_31155 [Streptomyces brevispora]|uniref:hypothetical protein n=1 Tax=Streptomyces brevispora TaxID=887462 RepID=UPI00371866ED
MSTPPIERIEIEVGDDYPVDGALIEHKGKYTLHLRPLQTLETATRHVQNVVPGITREAAERLIRVQCPEFRSLDDMLGVTDTPVLSVERLPGPDVLPGSESVGRRRRRRAVLVAALLPALAASWAVGRYTTAADSTTHQDAAVSAPDTAATDQAPFENTQFEFFSGFSKIECDPISTLEAECTDADGMVMASKAATGPDSTIFTFSYGSERIGLRIFYDPDYAATWARQDGSRELYPHMKVHGRYVLWGTDPSRIAEYTDLLQEADRSAGPHAMGVATPLPPRLAALTLGTLGLSSHEVNEIIARPFKAAYDAPTTMAARLVLGLDTSPMWSGNDGYDIVALALGIEPGAKHSDEVVVVPVTGPGTTSPTTTTPSTSTKPPTNPEPSKPPPSTTDTVVTPPVVTPPVVTPPVVTPPVAETPTPPVVTPPVAETPTPPVVVPSTPETPTVPPTDEGTPTVPPADSGTTDGQTPAPADTVTPDTPTDPTDELSDDLLILGSAWTVAA